MKPSIPRVVIAAFLCAPVAVGCAAADVEPEAEETLGQTQQAVNQDHSLIACANDVTVTLPGGTPTAQASTGTKPGCVNFFVDRNLANPQDIPPDVWTYASFPQYTGAWTATKDAQCRNSLIEIRLATRTAVGQSWADEYIEGWGLYAVPQVVLTGSGQQIIDCSVQITRRCDWHPEHDLIRVDVKAVPNGNQTNPGASTVRSTFRNQSTGC